MLDDDLVLDGILWSVCFASSVIIFVDTIRLHILGLRRSTTFPHYQSMLSTIASHFRIMLANPHIADLESASAEWLKLLRPYEKRIRLAKLLSSEDYYAKRVQHHMLKGDLSHFESFTYSLPIHP